MISDDMPQEHTMTASSWLCMSPAFLGRLQQSGPCYSAWCAQDADPQKWLEVDMNGVKYVTSVATQGSAEGSHVSTFYLNYTAVAETWITYEEKGKTKARIP